ncbi:MAG: hypothetical protein ABFS09_00165 [Thermodesulfobacteriota bacterium]
MARLLICFFSLLLFVPFQTEAAMLVDLQSSEGELQARLTISGDTLLNDDQGQPLLTAADQLLCTLTVSSPENMAVALPTFSGPNFGDFTLLDQGEAKTRRTAIGLESERQWLIEPYNPGPYQLPELLITARRGDMTTELILPRPELVAQEIQAGDEDLDDILPPAGPGKPVARIMALAAGALVILALAIWIFMRLKNKGPKCLPPKERALAEMALLTDLAPRDQVEGLAFILRCYLDSRFELRCLEQTYNEYGPTIAACEEIPRESRDIFLAVLEHCDLIKFSNIEPAPGKTEEIAAQIEKGLEPCPLAKPDDKTCGRW